MGVESVLDWYLVLCWACFPEFGFPIASPYLLCNLDAAAFAYGLDALTCVKFLGVDCLLHVNHSVPLFLIAGWLYPHQAYLRNFSSNLYSWPSPLVP